MSICWCVALVFKLPREVWDQVQLSSSVILRDVKLAPDQSNQKTIELQDDFNLGMQVDLRAHALPPTREQTSIRLSRSLKAENEPLSLTDIYIDVADNAAKSDNRTRETSTDPPPLPQSSFSPVSTTLSETVGQPLLSSDSGSVSGESTLIYSTPVLYGSQACNPRSL